MKKDNKFLRTIKVRFRAFINGFMKSFDIIFDILGDILPKNTYEFGILIGGISLGTGILCTFLLFIDIICKILGVY